MTGCHVQSGLATVTAVVKFTLEQAMKAQRGSRGMTRYPLYRRLGRPQGRSGPVLKISPPPEFDPRTFQPIARHYTDYTIPDPFVIYLYCKIFEYAKAQHIM